MKAHITQKILSTGFPFYISLGKIEDVILKFSVFLFVCKLLKITEIHWKFMINEKYIVNLQISQLTKMIQKWLSNQNLHVYVLFQMTQTDDSPPKKIGKNCGTI